MPTKATGLLGTVSERQAALLIGCFLLLMLAMFANLFEWRLADVNLSTLRTTEEEYSLTAKPLFLSSTESVVWAAVATDPRGESIGPWTNIQVRVEYGAVTERVDLAHNIYGREVAIVLHLHNSRLTK